jgi:tetratricopeptide (TPR) repeat protein
MLDELRKRAEDTPVATTDGIALNREIRRHAPNDAAAANRLGRGLQDVGHLEEALAVFEASLERNPGNSIARRRADALREQAGRARHGADIVLNGERTGGPGEPVLRRARKMWACEGRGTPAAHSLECSRQIAPGDRYVEITAGDVSYFDSHRVSLSCARDLWGYRV